MGSISLVGTSTTSLVACDTTTHYTEKQLKELKEKHKINTTNQEIKDNLEWIAPQEFWFNEIDNKLYYVVWRNYKSNGWRINKFKNNNISISIVMDNYPNLGKFRGRLQVSNSATDRILLENDYGTHFKSIYRWNSLNIHKPDLVLDENDNIKVKQKK
ncbi:hypothetical protein [Spiroplasma endosymbiont of Poecilobothrus nobilitatus]|uniref:hypothetical protein n=1 Tax=Spiroplasma endosymbiont of Poecilobothrus nobilitatus TaxID=1209220 RepID=UPI00313CF433